MEWEKRGSEIKQYVDNASLNDVISNVGAIWCYYKSGASWIPFDWQRMYIYGSERITSELGRERFEQLMSDAWDNQANGNDINATH